MISFNVPNDVKGLREALCSAQSLATLLSSNVSITHYLEHLQQLINECDRHRPLGPDGKHGKRHTSTCGCSDVDDETVWHVVETGHVFRWIDEMCVPLGLTPPEAYAIFEGRAKNYTGWTFECIRWESTSW
jgi:hypothetical protein